VVAALTLGFAEMEFNWERLTHQELLEFIHTTDLKEQMVAFGVWDAWADGTRGRTK